MREITLTINGQTTTITIEDQELLVDVLRDKLHLTGTHVGCDTTQCGCCTVLLNGRAIKSCTMLAIQAEGTDITTIEGLAKGDALHPMQRAFSKEHALQCGFCTPGMIMSAVALVAENPDPDEKAIVECLEGNLCRCTGYVNIVKAVAEGARVMRDR